MLPVFKPIAKLIRSDGQEFRSQNTEFRMKFELKFKFILTPDS
jgi:hypothetical protein